MITWLGFRHVKYGVRPHHIPIMGQVGRANAGPFSSCGLFSCREQVELQNPRSNAMGCKLTRRVSPQVLMAVLEKALGNQWTESMANAWTELWQVSQN